MKIEKTLYNLLIFFVILLGLAGCTTPSTQTPSNNGEKLKLVATTTIVGDVVSQVGGDHIDLHVLLPVGIDPHGFDPTPQDIAKVSEADLVFANGAGLEEFLENLIESAGASNRMIHLSDGVELLITEVDDNDHEHDSFDPHIWTDPKNVIIWVQKIERELSELNPQNTASYQQNAANYIVELETMDAWIQEQVKKIPSGNRKLITDHTMFTYFAAAYGFEQIGALIPGYSTLADPSAKDLAEIEDVIRGLGVDAIFVGYNVNPTLAERVSEDTGTLLVYVFTGSLSEPGGEAATYTAYMRYNTKAFVDALTPNN